MSPGFGRRVIRLASALGLALEVCHAGTAWAEPTREERATRVEALVRQARAAKLAERTEWRRLGHYRRGTFGGWTSEADGEPFFASPVGKSDPSAELEATLRAFFAPVPTDPLLTHALCRFPARRLWLAGELGIGGDELPKPNCARYDDYLARVRPASVTLIFSSYFLNNPASAFGHTFLRINKQIRPHQDAEARELLAYGVDYSAVVDTNNSVLYAFKGLTGLFPGVFHKIPYYYKVREYNDYESRDLWEYDLSLSAAQVQMLVAHLWELGSTYFAYYYLSENCSYHILGLLEAANPKLELLTHVGYPVIPIDTVKAVLANRGFVTQIQYRPSNRTQFKLRLEALTPSEQDAVGRLIRNAQAALPSSLDAAAQVRVLDTAIELASVRFARDLTKKRDEMDQAAIQLEQELLERRARYELTSEEPQFPAPLAQAPHTGHPSSRFGLGSGYDERRGYYHTANFRLALHDLADPARGFPDGAEIDFLPGSLRYYVESPKVTFEQLSLIRVKSLTPLTAFERAFSWQLDAGAKRTTDRGCRDCITGFTQLGIGYALRPGTALTLYAMLVGEVDMPLRAGYFDFLRVGAGPLAGLRARFSDEVTGLLTGGWSYLPFQIPNHLFEVEAKLRAQYTRGFALGLEAKASDETSSVQALSYIYF